MMGRPAIISVNPILAMMSSTSPRGIIPIPTASRLTPVSRMPAPHSCLPATAASVSATASVSTPGLASVPNSARAPAGASPPATHGLKGPRVPHGPQRRWARPRSSIGCGWYAISPGTQDSYLPGNAFDINFLKVDSDQAFEAAQKHGGDKILQQSADTPVSYLLEWNRAGNNLVWHVICGNSRNDAKLVVDVDATTGEFIRKEK